MWTDSPLAIAENVDLKKSMASSQLKFRIEPFLALLVAFNKKKPKLSNPSLTVALAFPTLQKYDTYWAPYKKQDKYKGLFPLPSKKLLFESMNSTVISKIRDQGVLSP